MPRPLSLSSSRKYYNYVLIMLIISRRIHFIFYSAFAILIMCFHYLLFLCKHFTTCSVVYMLVFFFCESVCIIHCMMTLWLLIDVPITVGSVHLFVCFICVCVCYCNLHSHTELSWRMDVHVLEGFGCLNTGPTVYTSG